jgi:hypothetical protein
MCARVENLWPGFRRVVSMITKRPRFGGAHRGSSSNGCTYRGRSILNFLVLAMRINIRKLERVV